MADKKGATIVIKKKKGGGHGGAHGGAWKVAYADFVTAMMCFFLVMWLMGSDEETKASVSGYFNHPELYNPFKTSPTDPKGGDSLGTLSQDEPPGGRPINMPIGKINAQTTADDQIAQVKELLEESISLDLGTSSPQDQVNLAYDSRGLVLKIVAKDFFAPHSSEIKPDFMPILKRIGKIMVSNSNRLIKIEGHTDTNEHKPNDASYSWQLSTARAQAVAQYWMQQFGDLDPRRLQIAGNSHYRNIASTKKKSGQASNRRVEIVLLNSEFLPTEEP